MRVRVLVRARVRTPARTPVTGALSKPQTEPLQSIIVNPPLVRWLILAGYSYLYSDWYELESPFLSFENADPSHGPATATVAIILFSEFTSGLISGKSHGKHMVTGP